MIDLIKNQIGSDGKRGWPVAVRDRIAYYAEDSLGESNVAVTFLWTMRDAVLPKLEKENLSIACNFYTPSGLVGMVRNILGNPKIRYIIMFGEEYSSKAEDATTNKNINELTSANAIRSFFNIGINEERKIDGFGNAVYFDKNIPAELIEKVRENVKLIDLNKEMPSSSFEDKIKEANRLLKVLEKKPAFLDRPYVFEYEQTKESFPYENGPLIVHGETIPEAWVKMIYNVYRFGRKNLMNANTDRWVKEINNMTVVIHDPQNMDLTLNPFLIPLTQEKIEAYKKEILSPILPEGKAYTYGNKLRAYYYPSVKEIKELVNSEGYKDFEFGKGEWLDSNLSYKDNYVEINQIQDIIDVLKRDPYSKACVAITWNVADELMRKHKSSPCLVFLQALVQDEKLNLTVFFRSHDMTQGWPENAYGCAAIQKEISEGIGLETGILTIISGSAQIYNNYYPQVEEMLKKYYKTLKDCNDKRGNYLIGIKNDEVIVKLTHPETGQELEEFRGKTAYELKDQIENSTDLNTNHALYLGTELQKAEIALKNNLVYEQDKEITNNSNNIPQTNFSQSNDVDKKIERPSWDEYFMAMAILTSSRSSCLNVRAGSILVKDNRIIGAGYNGAPSKVKNCLDMGCRKENKGLKYEDSLNIGHCIGAHSEMNALGHISSLKDRGFTLYTTIFPCHSCIKNLLAYGVERIVFKREYSKEENEKSMNILKETNVKLEKIDIDPERIIDILFNQKEVYFDIFSYPEKKRIKNLISNNKNNI
jgi:thymidylate synthase